MRKRIPQNELVAAAEALGAEVFEADVKFANARYQNEAFSLEDTAFGFTFSVWSTGQGNGRYATPVAAAAAAQVYLDRAVRNRAKQQPRETARF